VAQWVTRATGAKGREAPAACPSAARVRGEGQGAPPSAVQGGAALGKDDGSKQGADASVANMT
jgi:hypothetical protein